MCWVALGVGIKLMGGQCQNNNEYLKNSGRLQEIKMGKFVPGQSGNPRGKPKGALNKRTRLAKLLEPHAEALVNKAVELALNGDSQALRLCMERLIPKVNGDAMVELPHFEFDSNGAAMFEREVLKRFSGSEIGVKSAISLLAVLREYAGAITNSAERSLRDDEMSELIKKYTRDY